MQKDSLAQMLVSGTPMHDMPQAAALHGRMAAWPLLGQIHQGNTGVKRSLLTKKISLIFLQVDLLLLRFFLPSQVSSFNSNF